MVKRKKLLKLLGLGAAATGLSLLTQVEAAPPMPSLTISEYSLKGAYDLFVYREGSEAIAITRKGEKIASGTDHTAVWSEVISNASENDKIVALGKFDIEDIDIDKRLTICGLFENTEFNLKSDASYGFKVSSTSIYRVRFYNLAVKADGFGTGILLQDCKRPEVKDCYFEGLEKGVELRGINSWVGVPKIIDCEFYNCKYGIYCGDPSDANYITHFEFGENTIFGGPLWSEDWGIYIGKGTLGRVIGGSVNDCTYGVEVNGTVNTIAFTIFEGNTNHIVDNGYRTTIISFLPPSEITGTGTGRTVITANFYPTEPVWSVMSNINFGYYGGWMSLVLPVLNKVPEDADFKYPQDGMIVIGYDGTAYRLYARIAGSWIALT